MANRAMISGDTGRPNTGSSGYINALKKPPPLLTRPAPAPVSPPPAQRQPGYSVGGRVPSGPAAASPAQPNSRVGAAGGYAGRAAGSSGGGGGGGGVATASSTGAYGTATPAVALPLPPSDEDWWKEDDAFQAQQGGIESNRLSALANLTAQRQNYDTDLLSTLKSLGRSGDDPTKWKEGSQEGLGNWDITNKLGAYGQGVESLQNDFTSRGMADSSFFNTANQQFDTDMNNQFNNIVGSRGAFSKARNQDEQDAQANWKNALDAAKAESIARKAAKYGV